MSAKSLPSSAANRIAIGVPALMLLFCAFTFFFLEGDTIRIVAVVSTIVVVALCGALAGFQKGKS
ncbi:hypothetical protein GCM10027570_16430 [Streptomonospora sediminis]